MIQIWFDIQNIALVYCVFGLAYLANVVLSLYKNITITKEKFQFSRLLKGLTKFIVLVVGTLLIVVSIDLLVMISGLSHNDFSELISVATIVMSIGLAIVKYIKEAYLTLQDILTNTN